MRVKPNSSKPARVGWTCAISIQRRGVQASLRKDAQLCFYLLPIPEAETVKIGAGLFTKPFA